MSREVSPLQQVYNRQKAIIEEAKQLLMDQGWLEAVIADGYQYAVAHGYRRSEAKFLWDCAYSSARQHASQMEAWADEGPYGRNY